ncbi:A/G-specific adenine glycosylase domain protein [Streptococcus mitis]|uniref:A/G-specific adenine glycosylase domain protein n=1 Tax=Streptococcus mitis TaxID=28037 RepID=A0A081PQW3_STRMT|nr:A/G-specific adenine glycosylase domain protein [Streptococcus mitis]
MIRIFTPTPRQISFIFIIPSEKFLTKRSDFLLRPHDDTVLFQI